MSFASFVEAVRSTHGKKDGIKTPVQQTFTLDAWRAAYRAHGDGTPADRRLFEAGVWFHERTEAARAEWGALGRVPLPRPELVRRIVAAANAYVASPAFSGVPLGAALEAAPGATPNPAVQAAGTPGVAPEGGCRADRPPEGEAPGGALGEAPGEPQPLSASITRTAAVTSLYAGTRVALGNALDGKETEGPALDAADDAAVAAGVAARVRLGTQYAALEDLWAECLWAGWYVETAHPAGDLVLPADPARAAWVAVGGTRAEDLNVQIVEHWYAHWGALTPAERLDLVRTPAVGRLVPVGGSQEATQNATPDAAYDVAAEAPTAPPPADAPPLELVLQTRGGVWGVEALLGDPLPEYEGLTANDLLRARWVLAPIARLASLEADAEGGPAPGAAAARAAGALMAAAMGQPPTGQPPAGPSAVGGAVPSGNPNEPRVPPAAAAPRLRTASLVRALCAAGFRKADAARALKVLTFSDRRHDPWARPFVRLDAGHLTVLTAPLGSPNVRWLVDTWLREGGADLKRRGRALEADVRRRLVRDAAWLRTARVHPSPVRLWGAGPDGASTKEEELDLVFRVGATVVVGEIKCSLYPTDPHSAAGYEELLRKAGDQVARKADHVRRNLAAFLARVGWAGDVDPARARVLATVVTNLPHGPGVPTAGPPVTDYLLLRRFLRGEPILQYVTSTRHGVTSVAHRQQLYASPEAAALALESYLTEPPQLRPFLENLRVRRQPLGHFRGHPRPAFLLFISVELDTA